MKMFFNPAPALQRVASGEILIWCTKKVSTL